MSVVTRLQPSGSVRFGDLRSTVIDAGPGVYVVRYLEKRRPKRLARLGGIDKQGILCIGKAGNLRERILNFFRDIQFQDLHIHYHSEGWNWRRYFRDNPHPKALRLPI